MVRLSPVWTGTLCLLTISGLLNAGVIFVPEGFNVEKLNVNQRAFLVPIEIMNREFTAPLVNHDTKEYNDLYKEVATLFDGVYKCDDCSTKSFYDGVAAMGFGPGSVIANTVVVFNTTSINQVIAWVFFKRNAEKASGNLKLNMGFTNRGNVMEF